MVAKKNGMANHQNSNAINWRNGFIVELFSERGFGGWLHLPQIEEAGKLRSVQAGHIDRNEAFLQWRVWRDRIGRQGRVIFAVVEHNICIIDSSHLSRGGHGIIEVTDLVDKVQFLCLSGGKYAAIEC